MRELPFRYNRCWAIYWRKACDKINAEICQTLGKVLRYPWFKDDQENFPGATEENGVCVGDHVAETIAAEAALKIKELEAEVARLELSLRSFIHANRHAEEFSTEDLDQPATLEWVKERKGWNPREKIYLASEDSYVLRSKSRAAIAVFEQYDNEPALCFWEMWVNNPTRRQVIAAEVFVKEMGWM